MVAWDWVEGVRIRRWRGEGIDLGVWVEFEEDAGILDYWIRKV